MKDTINEGTGGRREPASRLPLTANADLVRIKPKYDPAIGLLDAGHGVRVKTNRTPWKTALRTNCEHCEGVMPPPASPAFLVVHPCWLIANGDSDRIDVARSPLVPDDDKWMEPIYQHISENGLVLAARETFDDDDWMFGEVEMSVFIGKRTESYGS